MGAMRQVTERIEALYRAHAQGLYSLALTITRDPASAEDAVDEAFTRLFKRGLLPAGDPVAYVFAAVRNAARDQRRRRAVEPLACASLFAERSDDPGQGLMAAEGDALLRAAVDALPDEEREVLVMRIYAGLSFAQVSAALDVPISTLSSRYQRALAQLRSALPEPDHVS